MALRDEELDGGVSLTDSSRLSINGQIVHSGTVQNAGDPVSIEVSKGQTGKIGWTIKVRGADLEDVLAKIKRTVKELKAELAEEASAGG